MNMFRTTLLLALVTASGSLAAHSGGLNAEGCHNDRKNGGYHCHRSPSPAPQRLRPATTPKNNFSNDDGNVYYPNCTAVRAAGADPVRRGEPGYASHLDRDNDGVGCE
ncbi:MAG: excalibur calcium-binding domain-containing protein [Pseudomonadota bacterium]|nr:excalibur calcium-binding domain-containing protein [Pseudomonadota bacterium]